MRSGSRVVLVALLVTAAVSGSAQQPHLTPPERASLETLLTRAAWYLDYFVDQFANVVAEDHPPWAADDEPAVDP